MTTAIAPIIAEVGLSQLVTRSPAAFPTGTRPDAMPPTAAPSMNGVRIDAAANTRSAAMPIRVVPAAERRTYVDPRRMMPIAATKNGTVRVDMIDANAVG